jgi:thiamine-monophosphate kinase
MRKKTMSAEFDLIKKYFTHPSNHTDVGIGDDAALISVSPGQQLAISTDMSVVGTHFFEDTDPFNIGWKTLAVNISDMAAMGATPKWATLSIALPSINEVWIDAFSKGFFACATQFNIDLIGGDTTRGSLNINVTIIGETPISKALKRDNAMLGDDIWVSGQLGSAALGLAFLQNNVRLNDEDRDACLSALYRPEPRVALGLAIRDIANSCIDISDGLLADFNHILTASRNKDNSRQQLGAILNLEQMPCIAAIKNNLHHPHFQQALLAGGDDYELCFTSSLNKKEAILTLAKHLNLSITHIGNINNSGKLDVLYQNQAITVNQLGYDHFA